MIREFRVEVGQVYHCLDKYDSHFISGDTITIIAIDSHVWYKYASDGWETKKEKRFFTTEWLKYPSKLERLLSGVEYVKMD